MHGNTLCAPWTLLCAESEGWEGGGEAETPAPNPTPSSFAPTPGISLKTQELYTLVFVCRYLDLFTR